LEYSSRYLEDLVERLSRLPTIGKKTAQRLAFHLMRVPVEEAQGLARAIQRIRDEVGSCTRCGISRRRNRAISRR
jgi:recombination protein RecR